jgi:2'-5' RNA ligase
MSTIRAFFAIMSPKSMSDLMSNVLESLKQFTPEHVIKWSRVENLHITLQFLKSIQPEHVVPLIEKVRIELKNTPTFQLEFHGLEWFPTPEHPKILSLAVGSKDILIPLSATIGHAISAFNYPVESRPFRGHMSIGRLLNYSSKQKALLNQIKLPIIPSIPINELYLIESKSSKGGSNYCPLAKFDLT